MGREKLSVLFILLAETASFCLATNVTYDSRSLVIDGKRKVLVSGSIHYPRSAPEMWPDLMKKSKEGGLDIVETYVFWNLHEPVRGQYDFTGRNDLVKFIQLAAQAGLYVHLRIGPYVCAEWNYGGFPLWLHFIPGIELRTDNQPYKDEMQKFTTKIVDLMKANNLYASQGGPIVLSQIENEYGNIQSGYGAGAKPYINWAAEMATSQQTGVPWVMCQQDDAPQSMINTCNGFYCDQFTPNSPQKPKFWTENWTGWFSEWGAPIPHRPAEDVAFAVARFYQLKGTLMNYYMYHGGTNFGRNAGGPFITTSYDYDAPIDEYGLVRQPKWGHLKDLHAAIKLMEPAMLVADAVTTTIGQNMEVTVYQSLKDNLCSAFLANWGDKTDAWANFNGSSYDLPAWSVSILPDCKNVAYNTAKVNAITTFPQFVRRGPTNGSAAVSRGSFSSWSWFKEPIGYKSNDSFNLLGLAEQVNATGDRSDFLWFSLTTQVNANDPLLGNSVLHVDSHGHALSAFVNGKLAGTGKGKSGFSVEIPVFLKPGNNNIDILSTTVGLSNYGAFFDLVPAGPTHIALKDSDTTATTDLSPQQWSYQIGLKGEQWGLSSGSDSPLWTSSQNGFPKKTPLTWYKTTFSAPAGNSPVAINFAGMGKGYAWVNGQNIGRFWPADIAHFDGCDTCDYKGGYVTNKCETGCGKPTQEYYHIPRSWLTSSGNVLVLLEEIGGDPTKISFATREVTHICSKVSETYPAPISMWNSNTTTPTLVLECPSPNQMISKLKFISYGNPHGSCGSLSHGSCRSPKIGNIIQRACQGKTRCEIQVSANNLGDPCPGITKSLAVEALCA